MCTAVRFVDAEKNLYFGRNLDWSCGYGQTPLVVPRNAARRWEYAGAQATGPAVVGMGILADALPLYFDCANENGLCVAGLNFPGFAQYEDRPISGKTNICAYEFPYWIASNFSSVADVRDVLTNCAIIGQAPTPKFSVSLLHWIIVDKDESIVVEYTKSGMQVFDDKLDVLTNQPGFAWHTENMRNYLQVSCKNPEAQTWSTQELSPFGAGFGMLGFPGGFGSVARFVRAAFLNAHYPEEAGEDANVCRLFKTLQGCACVKGGEQMDSGDFEYTLYTGGFSAKTHTYYYNTYEEPAIRAVVLDTLDLASTAPFCIS